jgi:Maf-like protein
VVECPRQLSIYLPQCRNPGCSIPNASHVPARRILHSFLVQNCARVISRCGVQGPAGAWVAELAGDYFNVMGLPVFRVAQTISELIELGELKL